jgi:hypothetical protein
MAARKPVSKKPVSKKPDAKKPDAKKPDAKKPSARRSGAGSGPVAAAPPVVIPKLGSFASIFDASQREVDAGRLLEKLLKGRLAVPPPPHADDVGVGDVLSLPQAQLGAELRRLQGAITAGREVVAQASRKRGNTEADLAEARAKLTTTEKLLSALNEMDATMYGAVFRLAFPHESTTDIGSTEPELQASVHRVYEAIRSLPEHHQGALHQLLGPLHGLDERLHTEGGPALGLAYVTLRRAEERLARTEQVIKAAIPLQYVDLPDEASRLLEPLRSSHPKKAEAPAPEPTPTPTPTPVTPP